MQEITYELTCDDCGTEYTLINIIRDDAVEDSPAYCPFCGTPQAHAFVDNDDEFDDMDIDDELDELDFDDD